MVRRAQWKQCVVSVVVWIAWAFSGSAMAETLTILHTNDLQSRLLGFAPNADYTPLTLNDDQTVGGQARLATAIRTIREQAPEKTLLLDGGDIFMGTLFHTLARETGTELLLMQQMGYDAAVLGNHEFDFRPEGLARILESASKAGPIPPLLSSNLRFALQDPADDALEAACLRGLIQESLVLERGGLKIGLIGVMGRQAASLVAPYAKPVTFDNPIETARRLARRLREKDKVDLVICLSHSGVHRSNSQEPWSGEDVEILRQVTEIDVLIGGHSHTPLHKPILVDGRPVVQAGSEAQFLGRLDLSVQNGKATVASYSLIPIDDSIATDAKINEQLEVYQEQVSEKILKPHGLAFNQIVLETGFDLLETERGNLSQSNLGPFAADAIRKGSGLQPPPDIALVTAGTVRDSLLRGQKGLQQVSDLYRILPLGIGTLDDQPGAPLTCFYVTAQEIRDICEVLSFAYQLKGPSYYPYFSGLRFRYNPYRIPLDRVLDIELGDEEAGFAALDFSANNTRLYSVLVDMYILNFVGVVEELSYGLVSVQPKNADGKPLVNLQDALLDADPSMPGVQELKEWLALLQAAKAFPDINGNGIPDVPERYRSSLARMVSSPGLGPFMLFGQSTWIMRSAGLLVVLLLGTLVWRLRRRLRSNKARV